MPLERALLNMIDGRRSASELRTRLAGFGNVNQLLRELFEDKLIELDPAYMSQFAKSQDEIANEAKAMIAATSPTTTARAVAATARTPRSTRDLSDALPPWPSRADDSLYPRGNDAPSSLQVPTTIDPYAEEVPAFTFSALALREAKAFAKRYVFDAIGSTGAELCMAIERATDAKEVRHATSAAHKVLLDLKGESVASAFDEKLRRILFES
jgi:DNA-binding transcriptional regulator YdaS (Cro superfamily)